MYRLWVQAHLGLVILHTLAVTVDECFQPFCFLANLHGEKANHSLQATGRHSINYVHWHWTCMSEYTTENAVEMHSHLC